LVLITNQSAVGRGIISLEQVMEINQHVIAEIEAQEGRIDASYLCPHHPDEGCNCRKPAPGMLLRAAEELGLDLTRSYVIGDAASDMEAAWAAGVHGILVLTGLGKEQVALLKTKGGANCPVVADLGAAVDHILPRSLRQAQDRAQDRFHEFTRREEKLKKTRDNSCSSWRRTQIANSE